ncbi:MAG: hypothetical protein EOM31_06385 [Bacteroidia bacterium]|nr:hypothetical protein [Bacteroidia bacterium]
MKVKQLTVAVVLMAFAALGTSCGNKQKTSSTTETEQMAQSSAMEVDTLLARGESLVGQEITVKGVCTHTCAHGAKKIFLMGSDDTQTIRVEATEVIGAFDAKKCVNAIVSVTGVLREQRIDEAYLQNWEEQVKAQAQEKHGDGEAGCSTEKKARGEKGNSTQERIQDFRTKIADRQAKTGKAYLSFYFVEATGYEIEG